MQYFSLCDQGVCQQSRHISCFSFYREKKKICMISYFSVLVQFDQNYILECIYVMSVMPQHQKNVSDNCSVHPSLSVTHFLVRTKTELVAGLTCSSSCSLCGIVLCCLPQSFTNQRLFSRQQPLYRAQLMNEYGLHRKPLSPACHSCTLEKQEKWT